MRSWGAARDAGALESIDVGINSGRVGECFFWGFGKTKTKRPTVLGSILVLTETGRYAKSYSEREYNRIHPIRTELWKL